MNAVLLVARLIFGGYFLYSGINHFTQHQQMAAYAAQHGVPGFLVSVSGAIIIVGGLHVLLGVMPRLGLLLIVGFLVPVSIVMHPFWSVADPAARMQQMIQFSKNIALIGGALGLMAVPVPWAYSVDGVIASKRRGTGVGYGRPVPH
jgi:putative oxidoreductase